MYWFKTEMPIAPLQSIYRYRMVLPEQVNHMVFLKYNDWQKIQSAVQVMTIGAVASSSNVNGASVTKSNDTLTLVLHPADATNPGIVTAGTQHLEGIKLLPAIQL